MIKVSLAEIARRETPKTPEKPGKTVPEAVISPFFGHFRRIPSPKHRFSSYLALIGEIRR